MAESEQREGREEEEEPSEPEGELSWGSLAQFQQDSTGRVPEALELKRILIQQEERNKLTPQKNSQLGLNNDGKSISLASQETILSRKSAGELCRICHDVGSTERFISPCLCKGSLSQVHKSCLERWLAESDTSDCELCGFKYKVARFPRYGLLMSVYAWLTSTSTWRDRRSVLVDVIALLIISPIICFSTMMALQLLDNLFIAEAEEAKLRRMDNPFSIAANPRRTVEKLGTMMAKIGQMGVISMILTMDMAFVSWLAMRLQFHVSSWYTWYRRNCKVSLIDFPGGSSLVSQTHVDDPGPTSSSNSVLPVSVT